MEVGMEGVAMEELVDKATVIVELAWNMTETEVNHKVVTINRKFKTPNDNSCEYSNFWKPWRKSTHNLLTLLHPPFQKSTMPRLEWWERPWPGFGPGPLMGSWLEYWHGRFPDWTSLHLCWNTLLHLQAPRPGHHFDSTKHLVNYYYQIILTQSIYFSNWHISSHLTVDGLMTAINKYRAPGHLKYYILQI